MPNWSPITKKLQSPTISSAGEVVFTVLVSNFALALSLFVTYLIDRDIEFTVAAAWVAFVANINPTEVLVYILAIITPTLWYMAVNARARKYLRGFTWIFALQCGLIVVSAIVFALAKTGLVLNEVVVVPFAWVSFFIAIAIWYGILVFQKSVRDGPHVDATDINTQDGIAAIKDGLR